MKKSLRLDVYEKYEHRCAYCGNYIEYEDMKVDHFVPQKNGGSDEISNLMPACEICNHFKDSHNIHKFKSLMKSIKRKIEKLYIIKVAQRFGLIKIEEFEDFYYEKVDRKS
jgi:5-methylcytosine-specific restriction endonuclease McrA